MRARCRKREAFVEWKHMLPEYGRYISEQTGRMINYIGFSTLLPENAADAVMIWLDCAAEICA